MTLRILIVDDQTGECEIGGVRCKVVPVEPTKAQMQAAQASEIEGYHGDYLVADDCYAAMLSVAAIDLSGLPVMPERETNLHLEAQILRGYQDGWNAALDAIRGAK